MKHTSNPTSILSPLPTAEATPKRANKVTSKATSNANRNLVDRGGVWYINLAYRGKRYLRSTGYAVGTLEDKHLAQAFRDRFRRDLRKEDMAALEAAQMRPGQPYATLGEVVQAFEAVATAGGLQARTAPGYVSALRSVLGEAGRDDAWRKLSTKVLTRELAQTYRDKILTEAAKDELHQRRARITVRSTLRQARALFTERARSEYGSTLALPDLTGWLAGGQVRIQADTYILPDADLIARTLKAGREQVEKQTDFAAAFLLCYDCGLRAGEAARAEWSWLQPDSIEVRAGKMWNQRRVARRVPLAPETYTELMGLRNPSTTHILKGDNLNQRTKLVQRELAKWMRKLGWDAEGENSVRMTCHHMSQV